MSTILNILIDKGIDIGASFIPGGSAMYSLAKSVGKILLGTENATEEEMKTAINQAGPEKIKQIHLEIQRLQNQKKQIDEKAEKYEILTKKIAIQKDMKLMDLIVNCINCGHGIYVVMIALSYYILLIFISAFYYFSDFDIFTKHCVVGLLTVMAFIPYSPLIGDGVMNRILNSLCDIFLNIAELGKGITSAPKLLINKIIKNR